MLVIGISHLPPFPPYLLPYLFPLTLPPFPPSPPSPPLLQSSLAQLGIPLMDVLKVLAAVMLLGNTLFYEAKNQELSLQGTDGELYCYG